MQLLMQWYWSAGGAAAVPPGGQAARSLQALALASQLSRERTGRGRRQRGKQYLAPCLDLLTFRDSRILSFRCALVKPTACSRILTLAMACCAGRGRRLRGRAVGQVALVDRVRGGECAPQQTAAAPATGIESDISHWLGRRQTFGIASARQNSAVVGTSTSVMTAKLGSQHLCARCQVAHSSKGLWP